jgi:carbonic anhydrase
MTGRTKSDTIAAPMKKLIRGIVEFRKNAQSEYRERFAHLALGQAPDTLLIACSDSRVAPNAFASADPGDMFVIRNVGNLIAPADKAGVSVSDESEGAAIEFSILKLGVRDIIVCGHSECGAMQALLSGNVPKNSPHLKAWLRHAEDALARDRAGQAPDSSLAPHNRLSQINALCQQDHLLTYPAVHDAMKAGRLRLHAWWFDLAHADVYSYDESLKRFILIDEANAAALLKRLS